MNVAAMVDEVARAVTSSVGRAIAPLQRQLDDLLAWRTAVGEIRSGVDGAKGDAGASGKDGTPGERGIDGRDGRDGADGKDGAPGERGVDGKDGAPGLHGKDGAAGVDGRDGKDGQYGMSGERGIAGADGKDGIDGKQGADGVNGRDGSDGIDGKDGASGVNGRDGSDGVNGKDGAQGVRGEKGDVASQEDIDAAVTKACALLLPAMVAKQYETLMPEIIARASVLVPPGRDGLPGRPGTVGENGRDGVSVEKVEVEHSDKRTHTLIMRMTDGGRYDMPIRLDGMVLDSDVHRSGVPYEKGDAVTHGGSYWIARKDTQATPGKSDDWRLAVKRGRDGKDAAEDQE